MAHLRLAARDPGAANLLVGFLSKHAPESQLTVDIWAMPRAGFIFERAGLRTMTFDENFNLGDIEAAWIRKPANLLITGTTYYAPFEPFLWKLARQHKCPTLAIIDLGSNLKERFEKGLPDFVGAMDAAQARELEKLGFKPHQILITGHPWLSPLLEQRDQVIEKTEIPKRGSGFRILFLSEAISRDVSQGLTSPFGFDEFDSFAVLQKAASMAANEGIKLSLGVKFHPCEDTEPFQRSLAGLNSLPGLTVFSIDRNEHPYPWVLWADLVTGMTSMLLVESILLKKPVVSIQPGLVREDTFLAAKLGYAQTLTDVRQAERVLRELIKSPAALEALRTRQQGFIDTIPKDSHEPISRWVRENVHQVSYGQQTSDNRLQT